MSQTNIMKELSELQKKAVKYDNLKGKYVEHGEKLRQAITILTELAKEIDPVAYIGTNQRQRSGINFQEYVREFYEKMLGGVHISSNLISQTYPELDAKQVAYIMKSISDKGGNKILKRRDGRTVFYYVLREQ